MQTTSQRVKEAGLKSTKQMAEMVGKSPRAIENWFNNDRKYFERLLLSCVLEKTGFVNIKKG